MTPTRRALATFGSVGIALLLISCGVDAGDAAKTTSSSSGSGQTTATTEAPNLTGSQQEMADKMADAYRDLGFSDEESTCLANGLAGSLGPDGATPDITGMMDVVNECDISMDRLMDIQGGMGDGSTEGAVKESLKSGFKASGLSDEDASCVADAFVKKYGVDVQAMTDPSKIADLAEQCGVDPSKLGN